MSQVLTGSWFAAALFAASPNYPSFSSNFAAQTAVFLFFSTTLPTMRGLFA